MKRKNFLLVLVFVILIAVGGGVAAFFAFSNSLQVNVSNQVSSYFSQNLARLATELKVSVNSETNKPEFLSMNTLWFGDIYLGRGVHSFAESSELGFAQPFAELDSLQRENYDAWIGNLECPITKEQVTDYQESKLLKFSCRSEYAPEAAKWFDVFSLANNHTDNMEEFDGLSQTRNYLDQENIQYFGHFDNAVKEDICEIVSLPTSAVFSTATDSLDIPNNRKYKIPVALCGYHNIFKAPTAEEIAVISQYADRFITIAMPHQGVEYVTAPDSLKQRNFKAMIDAGADFVVGGHPHVVQPFAAHQGKLIAYSLGNTIFDQQRNYEVRTGAALELNFEFEYTDELEQWTELAADCRQFKDKCLEMATELDLQRPNYTVKVDVIATTNEGMQTRRGNDVDQQFIRQRTQIDQVLPQLDFTN